MINESYFSPDIRDFLYLLYQHEVHYLIVGGEAVIYHGYARLTGDIDIFYDREEQNADRLFNALVEFWQHDIPGIADKNELRQPGVVFQFGVPPNRIDLMNEIENVAFHAAWENRKTESLTVTGTQIKVFYIGLEALIENKRALGRYRDKEDLNYLNSVRK